MIIEKNTTANSGYIQVGGTVVMQSDEVFSYFRAGLTGKHFIHAALIYSRGTLVAILSKRTKADSFLKKIKINLLIYQFLVTLTKI